MSCSECRRCRKCGRDVSGDWPTRQGLCLTCAGDRIAELEDEAQGPLMRAMHEAASIVCHRIAQFGAASTQADEAHKHWAVAWIRWRNSPEAEGT